MAAVFADESRVAPMIALAENGVEIACLNGPANVVVSGEVKLIEKLCSD